jgi:hypothetical protein
MPKKNLLIAGAALFLLLIVGAGLMFMAKTSRKNVPESTLPKETVSDQSGVFATKESIKSLFSSGKNVTCSVAYPDNGGGGTMFIADKKMRGDFSTKDASGKQLESHMILDGDTSYSWMGAQGVKMKIDASVKASPGSSSAGQTADLDKQEDMSCSGWSVDNSKFVVPGDIKFMDATSFTGQTQTKTQTGGSSTPGDSKSACGAITDPTAKAACMGATGAGGY